MRPAALKIAKSQAVQSLNRFQGHKHEALAMSDFT